MKHFLARRALRPLSALLAVGLLTAVPALAQPGMNDNGGGPGMKGPGMNDNGGGRGGNRGDRSQMQAQMIARALQSAGYTDAGLLEAVTTYVANRQAARKPLHDAANALSQALTDETITDAQMATLWDDFNATLSAEKTRTATAEAALDKQIGYSKAPKLAAALTLSGVTGDAMSYLGGAQGGRGGPGGGRGGMNGGPGGRGGPGGGRGGMDGGPGGDGPDGMGGPGGGRGGGGGGGGRGGDQ